MGSAFFAQQPFGWKPPAPQREPPGSSSGAAAALAVAARPAVPPPPLPQFPASRTHLWDRTPSGPVMVVDLRNLTLRVQLGPDAWPLLQRLQQGAAGAAALQARLLPGSSIGRGGLAVELGIGATTPHSAAVPVALGAATPGGELGCALEVAASRAPAPAGLANLLAMRLSCQADGRGGLLLEGIAATPAPILDFKPLLAKHVAPSPLAQRLQAQLARPAAVAAPPEDGLLSLDRGRSLVPLPASDPAAYSTPLVGCWVAGVGDTRHPLAAAACLRFLCRCAACLPEGLGQGGGAERAGLCARHRPA